MANAVIPHMPAERRVSLAHNSRVSVRGIDLQVSQYAERQAVVEPQATVIQLLNQLHELVPSRGESSAYLGVEFRQLGVPASLDDPAVTQHRPGLRHRAGLFGGTCPPVFP